MKLAKCLTAGVFSGLVLMAAGACSAPDEGESIGTVAEDIVNGTAANLTQNTFVRLPTPGCTGTLLNNLWAITANHCTLNVGNVVQLDSQTRTVVQVVPHPEVSFGVDISLFKLSAPMAVGGSTLGFSRKLRTTVAPAGTHVRCFGYGQSSEGAGITSVLRYMSLNTLGGPNDVYYLQRNALLQSATPGDAGGGCLDDDGKAIAVMRSFTWAPTTPGETAAVSSNHYASWANNVISTCNSNADCSAGVCNLTTHHCVTNQCFDGVKNNGETGIDCGGPCAACEDECPPPMVQCGPQCVVPKACPDGPTAH